MPALVKLSRNVYDRLGDDVVTELVDWFNSMDASSHESLRELNELNFSRFDAKLEQRTAELRAEMKAGFVAVDAKLDVRTAQLKELIASSKANLLKWMVVMWATTLLAPFLANWAR